MKRIIKRSKRLTALLLSVLLTARMIPVLPASAEQAAEFTRTAKYTASGGSQTGVLVDGNESTVCNFGAGGTLTVTCEDLISGISVKFNRKAVPWKVSAGQYELQCGQYGFLHDYADLRDFISNTVTLSFQQAAAVSEIRVFGAGELPADVQVWEPPCEKADLLLCSTHSDDEHLFFLGMIPTMAAKGYHVQVAYFVHHNGEPARLHEQLNGLWTAGARHYPAIGRFPDQYSTSTAAAKSNFAAAGVSYDTVVAYQVEMLRRFRPDVVVGHDVNGEYGHGQHRLNAETLQKALTLSADPSAYPASAQQYGTWDVPKAYLHLWGQNQIVMNYDTPLEYFGGRTAYQVSIAAYSCHLSQQYTWFTTWARGANRQFTKASQITSYSPCRFGLYRTTGGLDSGTGDLFEHLDLLRGDADGDGAVTAADAQLVLCDYAERVAGNPGILSARYANAADVNSDGAASVEDAQMILRYYVLNSVSGIPTAWEAL